MATSWNYSSSETTKNIAVPDIDYSKFAEVTRKDRDIVITNSESPIDRPETMRFALSNINNVYNGSGIEPSYYAVNKTGKSLLLQVNDILTFTDANQADLREDYPITAHLVVKFPTNVNVDATVIMTTVNRLLATAYATGVTTNTRLEALIRGALAPSNLG